MNTFFDMHFTYQTVGWFIAVAIMTWQSFHHINEKEKLQKQIQQLEARLTIKQMLIEQLEEMNLTSDEDETTATDFTITPEYDTKKQVHRNYGDILAEEITLHFHINEDA